MPRAAPAGCDRTVPASTQRTIVIRAMQVFLDPKWLPSEARQHAPQPLLELDLRFPAQHLPGSGDVGLTNLRIVDGQRLVDDLALDDVTRITVCASSRIENSSGLPRFTGRCSSLSASR